MARGPLRGDIYRLLLGGDSLLLGGDITSKRWRFLTHVKRVCRLIECSFSSSLLESKWCKSHKEGIHLFAEETCEGSFFEEEAGRKGAEKFNSLICCPKLWKPIVKIIYTALFPFFVCLFFYSFWV